MAVKKVLDKNIAEIKKNLGSYKLLMGKDRTLKSLKVGNVAVVYVSSNCEDSLLETINHYASLNNTKVVELRCPNEELGTLCKKPFSISVLCVLK